MAHAYFTCVAIDYDETGVTYPQLGRLSIEKKCLIYLRCAYCLFHTLRQNVPATEAECIFYFSLPSAARTKKVLSFLSDIEKLGVELADLPFEKFKIGPGLSKEFASAYYKNDTFYDIAYRSNISSATFLDSDCIATDSQFRQVENGDVYLYDIYGMQDLANSYAKKKQESLRFMAESVGVYPAFLQTPLIQFGGEFTSGPTSFFRELTTTALELLQIINSKSRGDLEAPSGTAITDGDELLNSIALAMNSQQFHDALTLKLVRRQWTQGYRNIDEGSAQYSIWHLPSEKQDGFKKLYGELVSGTRPSRESLGRTFSLDPGIKNKLRQALRAVYRS